MCIVIEKAYTAKSRNANVANQFKCNIVAAVVEDSISSSDLREGSRPSCSQVVC